jgi:hypothetical protein
MSEYHVEPGGMHSRMVVVNVERLANTGGLGLAPVMWCSLENVVVASGQGASSGMPLGDAQRKAL